MESLYPAQELNKLQPKKFHNSLWKIRPVGSQGILESLWSFASILVQGKKQHLIDFPYNHVYQVTYCLSSFYSLAMWTLSRRINGEKLASVKYTAWWHFCSMQPLKDHHWNQTLLMTSCSRAINHVSKISRLTQHVWCQPVPPHLVFLNSGIALPHAVLEQCSASWIFVWLGFFCILIDSYRHLDCRVFLTLPNSFGIKESYLVVTTMEHLPMKSMTGRSLAPMKAFPLT